MKVLIDTNILISAALFPNSVPAHAYNKAVTHPYHGLVCEQNLDEMRRIFNRKFPSKLSALDRFLAISATALEIVPTPDEEDLAEQKIRDVNDRGILRAALFADADFLLTGDKDFLESGLEHPEIVSASAFIAREQ
jgi:putative PIN family toxin of toxin-antitoxin system